MFENAPAGNSSGNSAAAPAAHWLRNALTLFRDALRGVPMDLTTAPIGKAVVMLAVPMILEMFMENVFALVDVFWVAHLGPNAIVAVGLTESMMTIIYSVALGVSLGAMATVARRVGEKDIDGAARSAGQASRSASRWRSPSAPSVSSSRRASCDSWAPTSRWWQRATTSPG